MAEYYSNQFGGSRSRDSRQRRRSPWMVMLDVVMIALSVITAIIMLIILGGRIFEPDKLWYFSLTGLISPIIYLVAIALSLYWVIRWRWRMFLFVAVFVAMGWPYVSLYYKMNIGKEYGEPQYERGNIKVLTYNVRYLTDESWTESTTDSILTFVKSENPDIICFQEFPTKGEEYDKVIEALSKYKSSKMLTSEYDGVICFSKHRIIRTDSISGFCGTGKGVWADIKINNDTVRIYNLHLQTTSINLDEREYINNIEFLEPADTSHFSKFADMTQRLHENSCMRAHQVDAIHHDIKHCPYPVIVCGDFNDVPMSYTYRTVASGLKDTFREQGNGYASTFKGFFNLLRIDYILVSKQFETLSYKVTPLEWSDHNPVTARVILKNR